MVIDEGLKKRMEVALISGNKDEAITLKILDDMNN